MPGVAASPDRPERALITRLEAMPDRCEVLPGDSVVARRGGGLLWVDAPGSPALVAALHACLGVSGPGADRVLSAVAGQVSSLAHGSASFAIVLADSSGSAGTGVALWSGKGQPAVDGVPVSGSSVEGCTLASGFTLGQTLYVGPGAAAPQMPPGVAYDLVEGTVPGSGAMLQLARAASSASSAVPAAPAGPSPFSASSDAGIGSGATRAPSSAVESGEQTAFWRPEQTAAPVLRFDDGMVVTVDEDLVLGRRPDNHELVASGSARPVPIADTQNVLSSAHAALQRSGREVSLVDLGSLNGTHVAGPDATEWTQLEPGVAHPLSDGDRLLLGWTVITFEQPDAAGRELDRAGCHGGPLRRGAGQVLGGDDQLVAVGPRRPRQLHGDRLRPGVHLHQVAVVEHAPPDRVAVPDPAAVEVHADGLQAGVEPVR